MIGWREPCFSLQRTRDLFSKKISNSLSPQINIKSYQSQSLSIMKKPFAACLLFWALSNSTTHVRNFSYSNDQDHVHAHSYAILLHWKIASISIHHKIKLQVTPWLPLSKVIINDVGYTKRNKRCIPKEGMPHAHKACQRKEKKKKKDGPHPKEIKEREMVHEKEFIHRPPKKKKIFISPHTCTSWSRFMTYLFLDLDFDLAT